MNRFIQLAATATFLAAFAAQAQAPQVRGAITLQGAGPFYRLDLPIALYGHAAFQDLRDVRVRNASGNAVPYAWLDAESETPAALEALAEASLKVSATHAPLFAMPQALSAGAVPVAASDAMMAFKLRPDGSLAMVKVPTAPPVLVSERAVAEWLIDASEVVGDMVQLRLELAPGPQGVFAFTLEASDDLRHWRRVADDAQLVRLQHGGQSIERLSLELDHPKARYLQLRWHDPAHAPLLSAAWVDSVQSVPVPAVPGSVEWSPEVRPLACGADYCDYAVPNGLPVQSLRIALSDANTLAPLRIFSVALPGTVPAPAPSRRHNALYALRHGRAAAAREPVAASPLEQLLADTVVYRLNQPGGEARSSNVPFDGSLHTTLRLRSDGPIAALGATPPTLFFAGRPRSLAFLAQGNAPFTLSWATAPQDAVAAAGALPLSKLMPGYQTVGALTLDVASVLLESLPPVNTVMPATGTVSAAKVVKPAPVNTATSRPWLWAALGAGLLVLGGMAWSLLRGLKDEESLNGSPKER